MLKGKLGRSSKMQNEKNKERQDPIVEKFIRFCASDFGRKVMDAEADYLRKKLAGRKKILEIGCGIGAFEQRLSDLNITGLDSSEAMLEEARKRSNKTFIRGSAYALPFPDSSFDAVFFVTTLEFLDDYRKAIEEAARVLEKGGKLIVMMLNPESEYFKIHFQKPDDYFRTIKHTNTEEIWRWASNFFELQGEYFLGIRSNEVFDSSDRSFAALYVIKGMRKLKIFE